MAQLTNGLSHSMKSVPNTSPTFELKSGLEP